MKTSNANATGKSVPIINFENQYKGRFGTVAGYNTHEIEHLGPWLSNLVKTAKEAKANLGDSYQLQPSVAQLGRIIYGNPGYESQVTDMIQQGLVIHHHYEPGVQYGIENIDDLLLALNHIILNAPIFAPNVSHSAFPMSGLFVYMMATPAGWNVLREAWFNDPLRNILDVWCKFLSSPSSLYVVTTQEEGWLSPKSVIKNNLNEFVTEAQKVADPIHWGFTSFNDYFHRQIILSYRPLSGPGDDKIVVSANDGTLYRLARGVKRECDFNLKSQPYSLVNMLDNIMVDKFVGGDVLQTFLSGNDYHRWRAPISGTVIKTKKVPAYMFSELLSEGFDSSAGTMSQGYEANVNTRALIFIQSNDPVLGIVCVMPIGITEISSIEIQVEENDWVDKGDELGWFSYGGSSMCLIFQPGAIESFTLPQHIDPNNPPTVKVRDQIAIANSSNN